MKVDVKTVGLIAVVSLVTLVAVKKFAPVSVTKML